MRRPTRRRRRRCHARCVLPGAAAAADRTPPHTPTAGAANQGGPAHVAMPTKPCMVMLRTGVDGGRYQEDGAVWAVVPCVVCVHGCVCASQRLRLSLRKNRRRRETDSMIILQLGDRRSTHRPSARRLRIQESKTSFEGAGPLSSRPSPDRPGHPRRRSRRSRRRAR